MDVQGTMGSQAKMDPPRPSIMTHIPSYPLNAHAKRTLGLKGTLVLRVQLDRRVLTEALDSPEAMESQAHQVL